MREDLPIEVTHEVRDRCLCFRLQKAARILGRIFDDAFRPFGISNGQFSIMAALNVPEPRIVGDLARGLGMDRTTLTAALKPLQRRGLVEVFPDDRDKRVRRAALTRQGQDLLATLIPVWRETHDRVDAAIGSVDELRDGLDRIAASDA